MAQTSGRALKPAAVKVVAVVGAECSGKSTLSQALGRALPAQVAPEFLRHWCLENGRTPSALEQGAILQGQLAWQQRAVDEASRQGIGWVVCDCAPLLTAVYSIEYFGDDALLEQALAHHRNYQHTLVADASIDWSADSFLRDGPSMRERVDRRLRAILAGHAIACTPIQGSPDQRVLRALDALGARRPGV